MEKTKRKIELMHDIFGKQDSYKCAECCNLITKRWQRTYRKCIVYGDTSSEATDWAKSWVACGMFNKNYSGNNIVSLVKKNNDIDVPMNGQMELQIIFKEE